MKLRTCPQCGSTDIRSTARIVLLGVAGTTYICNTCGYTGDFIIEQDIDRKFKK